MDQNLDQNCEIHISIPKELRDKIRAMDGTTYAYLIKVGYDYIKGQLKDRDNEENLRREKQLSNLVSRYYALSERMRAIELKLRIGDDN